jgi:membrane-associated protease RseP (regulator of RpoE activity)
MADPSNRSKLLSLSLGSWPNQNCPDSIGSGSAALLNIAPSTISLIPPISMITAIHIVAAFLIQQLFFFIYSVTD